MDTPDRNVKLFSKNSIATATFLGGVAAGCTLIGLNFRNMGSPRLATVTIVGGFLLATIHFLWILDLTQDERRPYVLFIMPLAFTAILYYVADRLQGYVLLRHEQAGHTFYSLWLAAGVGFVFMLFTIGATYLHIESQITRSVNHYNRLSEEISEYDALALEVYDYLDRGDSTGAANYIVATALPALEKMENLVMEMQKINIPGKEGKEQLRHLDRYIYWRRQAFRYLLNNIENNTPDHQLQINEAHRKIDSLMRIIE